jgi:hypothetical protein
MLKTLTARKQIPTDAALTIRFATAADAPALARLAELDSSGAPTGEVLVAEVAGELWSALSLETGAAVSDPFHPSAESLLMLAERARGLRRRETRRTHRLPRLHIA